MMDTQTTTVLGIDPNKQYTEEEYFALEAQSIDKLEYYKGTIIPMAGGTDVHNKIAARMIAMLVYALDEREEIYHIYSSDMKIQLPAYERYIFPDAVVVCKAPEFYKGRRDIIVNPLLVVEVLSASTRAYDRQGKFMDYRTLPSFKEYIMVHQDRPAVTTFYRQASHQWEDIDVEGLNQTVTLQSVGITLPLNKIYKGVTF